MSKIKMGEGSYGSPIIRGDISDVIIGKYCSIAQGVVMDCGWHHNIKFISTYPFSAMFKELSHLKGHPVSKGDIVICNDVWIGEGALIMSGVVIGNGAVIGAHSVVTKDVDDYRIVAGNPAKVIRLRYNGTIIKSLNQIAWWDWPKEKILRNAEFLMNEDVVEFIKLHT